MATKKNATDLGLIVVEVDGTGIEQGRTYTDKNSGLTKPLPGRQTAYIWQGGKYPTEISIDIPDGKGPYRPGMYLLAGAVFESGKFGRLEFKGGRELRLVEVGEAVEALNLSIREDNAASNLKAVGA